MKKINLFTLAVLSSALVACGGGSSGSPSKPNLCNELQIEDCDQVVMPSSSSSSTSSYEPPINDLLPMTEDFLVDDALQFFSQEYKPLLDPNPEDPNNAFYYATSGLDSGRIAVSDGKLTIGNARFTIGQRLQTTGSHINPDIPPADYKADTTTAATTITWGDLDLRNHWKISFCVEEWEYTGTNPSNQQFMIYVDNNTSGSANSIHTGNTSLVRNLNIGNFAAGKRVEFNIPGDVLVGGASVDSVLLNPGTSSSFIQLRVPSAGVVTMSDLWIGYQADTSTEPAASTCTAGERVSGWNVPLPAATPTTAPTAEARDSQLVISWSPLARASAYQVAYNTVNSVEGATLSDDITGVNTTSYTINGLQNGQSYYVFLRAKNSANVYTTWSPSVTASPQAAQVAPIAPQVPILLAGNGQIEVSWSAVENANSYQVAYNTVDNPAFATVFGEPVTNTSLVLTGLTNDVNYYVYIKAINSAGESAYSEPGQATPIAPVETDWVGQVVDLIGGAADPEVGTAPTGSITEEQDGEVIVLRASGGVMNSDTGFRVFFAHKPVSGEFRFTARIASVTTASGEFTAPGNSYGYGLMVMQDVPEEPVASYASVPRFATMNLFTNSVVPTFAGSRAVKVDSVTGNRSRSNVDGLTVGHYVRLEVFVDSANPSAKRIRRLTSTDGIEFTQANSTLWSGSVGNDWYVGFYGAPGAEDLFIRFDNVVLEPYEAASSSSVAQSSESSSSSSSSVASSETSSESSVASSSETSSSSSSSEASSEASSESSSSSSELNGGTSSESSSSSSVAASALLTEAFTAADTATFFSADYKAMPADSGKALYRALAGESRIALNDGQLSLNNARFSIGDLSEGVATTGSAQPNGAFDLSQPYRIKFTILAATGTGNFQVYVDNNTTSAGNSIHTTPESTTVSRLLQVTPSSIESFPYDVVIESSVGTPNSFFQIRADSNITNLVIDNLVIEYQ